MIDGGDSRQSVKTGGGLRALLLLALVGLAIGSGLVYFFSRPDSRLPDEGLAGAVGNPQIASGQDLAAPSSDEGVEKSSSAQVSSTGPDEVEVIVLDVAATADQLHSEDIDPRDDLEILQTLIGAYRRIDGANPSGGINSEIVAVLSGKNARNIAVISPDHPSLNASGELVDRWGNPYWFHPVSRTVMEVASAGPDGELFTDDDMHLGDDAE